MIVLSSYPKSGNTWIRLLLTAYHNETRLIGENEDSEYYYQVVSPKKDPSQSELAALRPAMLMHLAESARFKPVLVKSHWMYGQYEGILLFPESIVHKAINVVRDPRAIAVSYAHHMDKTIDEAIDILNEPTWRLDGILQQVTGTWSQHVNSWQDTKFPTKLVRYEDINHETFSEILEFLGAEPDKRRVSMAFDYMNFDSLKKKEEKDGFKEAPEGRVFFRSGYNDWPEILTDKQINRIESNHRDTMQELGYL